MNSSRNEIQITLNQEANSAYHEQFLLLQQQQQFQPTADSYRNSPFPPVVNQTIISSPLASPPLLSMQQQQQMNFASSSATAVAQVASVHQQSTIQHLTFDKITDDFVQDYMVSYKKLFFEEKEKQRVTTEMQQKLSTKQYPSYISNLKIKNVYSTFPKSTPNVELYINRQQEAIDQHMSTMYGIIVEGYVADWTLSKSKLDSFITENEIIAAAKLWIPNLPDNNLIYNNILLKVQKELELFNYNQHKKQQIANNKIKSQQFNNNSSAVKMDDDQPKNGFLTEELLNKFKSSLMIEIDNKLRLANNNNYNNNAKTRNNNNNQRRGRSRSRSTNYDNNKNNNNNNRLNGFGNGNGHTSNNRRRNHHPKRDKSVSSNKSSRSRSTNNSRYRSKSRNRNRNQNQKKCRSNSNRSNSNNSNRKNENQGKGNQNQKNSKKQGKNN
jgi:hypothetical protein